MKKIDLTGQKFGRLTVIKDSGERYKRGDILWLCRCKCGEETYVCSRNLREGMTRSCGCFRSDKLRKRFRELRKQKALSGEKNE